MTNKIPFKKLRNINGNICYPLLLPKGLLPSDYCITDNVIELEEQPGGDRFWIKTQLLFKIDFIPDKKVLAIEFDDKSIIYHQYVFKTITDAKIKNRYYLLAILEKIINP